MTAHAAPPVLVDLAQLDNEHVLQRLESSVEGLSESDAEARLQKYGPNAVAHEARQSIAMQLLRRVRNPLNLMLLTLACISLVMGDHEAAIIIFIMVVLSSLTQLQIISPYRLSSTYPACGCQKGMPLAIDTPHLAVYRYIFRVALYSDS
jgi:magnesium-transporting ATPase (P-type)